MLDKIPLRLAQVKQSGKFLCFALYAAEKTMCLFVKIRPFSTSADLEQVSMNLVVKRFFNCSLFRMLRSIREPPAESFSLGPHRRRCLDRCHCHRNSCSGCRRNSEMRPNKRFLKAMKDFCFIIFSYKYICTYCIVCIKFTIFQRFHTMARLFTLFI